MSVLMAVVTLSSCTGFKRWAYTRGDRDAWHADQIDPRRVHHQRRVDAFEGSVPRHQLLAAAALFGGRAKEAHLAGQMVAELVQSQGSTKRGGGGTGLGRARSPFASRVSDVPRLVRSEPGSSAGTGRASGVFASQSKPQALRTSPLRFLLSFVVSRHPTESSCGGGTIWRVRSYVI